MGVRSKLSTLFVFCAAAFAGCGGGSGQDAAVPGTETGSPAPAPAPTPSPSPAPSPAPAPSPSVGTATLHWGASSDSRVAGYRVYYGTSSGSYQPKGTGANASTSTSYVASGLTIGVTYYFAVTAYDASGNESDYSAEVSKTVK